MDFIWIFFAFSCGLIAKFLSFPPSIGYLIAGFALNFLGYQADDSLTILSNLGITLMLFTIGLKLNVKSLFKNEVWLTSSLHTTIWIAVTLIIIKLFTIASISYFTELETLTAILVAFALSFSSTVCVIKLLEENGEMRTRHGKLAVGILVIQDIVAVAFLVFATGKTPSVWALALLLLFFVKPLINKIVSHIGHGELIPLAGFFIALGSYELFELVNIKGDLGALLIGMYLSTHAKASEINKSLLSFKDLLLIGFFLTIGLTALPDLNMIVLAIVFCLFIPLKAALFFGLFTSLRLRGRTAYLSSLVLSNYSEFGLIVGALTVSLGLLANSWLVVIALAVSISFIFTSVLYRNSHSRYHKYKQTIKRFEKPERLKEDIYPTLHNAEFLVLGMGRVGRGAFNALSKLSEVNVWGMDADRVKIKEMASEGLNVICGDGEDVDLWDNLDIQQVQLVLLALPSIQDSINITRQLKNAGYTGKVAAIARYEDEVSHLLENGVDKVFNFFTEAGLGFAEESLAYAHAQQ